MSEENLSGTSTVHDIEDKVKALAAGINSLLAFNLKEFAESDNGEAYSACLSTMALIVRVFEGEEQSVKMLDLYTNGAFSKMDGLVDAGVNPEEDKSIGRIGHKHTDQRRNLIIATAAGADLATDIAAGNLDQATL